MAFDLASVEGAADLAALRSSGAAPVSTDEITGNIVQFFKNGNAASLVMTNRTNQPQVTNYVIQVLDGDDGRWKLHTQGVATIQPNTSYEQGFHKWRAADWSANWW